LLGVLGSASDTLFYTDTALVLAGLSPCSSALLVSSLVYFRIISFTICRRLIFSVGLIIGFSGVAAFVNVAVAVVVVVVATDFTVHLADTIPGRSITDFIACALHSAAGVVLDAFAPLIVCAAGPDTITAIYSTGYCVALCTITADLVYVAVTIFVDSVACSVKGAGFLFVCADALACLFIADMPFNTLYAAAGVNLLAGAPPSRTISALGVILLTVFIACGILVDTLVEAIYIESHTAINAIVKAITAVFLT
jgi:hypothetical protein